MLRRVIEGIVVAVISSVAAVVISNSSQREALVDGLLRAISQHAGPAFTPLWVIAGVLFISGALIQVQLMIPRRPVGSWDVSVTLPSLPRALVGLGVVVSSGAIALQFAEVGSSWALPSLAASIYLGYRWLSTIRSRLRRFAGVL